MRTRPYRNARIITILRELFFAGGTMSFAQRHHSLFPMIRQLSAVCVTER